MRTKTFLMLSLLIAAGLFAGCSKDIDTDIPPPGEGDVTVRLTVIDGQKAIGRAAGTGTETIVGDETVLSGVKAVVFDVTNNRYETKADITLDGSNKATATFRVSAGEKRFYVVSGPLTIETLTGSTTMQAFEKKVQNVVFDANGLPDMAKNPYAIGTLWGDVTTVIPSGTVTNNVVDVKLQVGRMAGKIKLQKVDFTVGSDGSVLTGSFDTNGAMYRIGAVPVTYYLVGQYKGTKSPVTETGVEVVSAVHEEGWEDPDNAGQWNPAFRSNAGFAYKPVNTDVANESDFFYAVENTTSGFIGGANNLFYGNTTFLQVKIKYTPAAGELKDADDPGAAGSTFPEGDDSKGIHRPAGTFWATLKDGKQILFDNVPETGKFDDGAPIYCYEGGINYYKFPVTDPGETTAVAKYRVLRNHYYLMSIRNIKNLGSDVATVDPQTPIPQDFDVQVEVEVLKWSKVVNDDIILE